MVLPSAIQPVVASVYGAAAFARVATAAAAPESHSDSRALTSLSGGLMRRSSPYTRDEKHILAFEDGHVQQDQRRKTAVEKRYPSRQTIRSVLFDLGQVLFAHGKRHGSDGRESFRWTLSLGTWSIRKLTIDFCYRCEL